MKRVLFCLLVWMASIVTLSAGTRIIPIAGHLPGGNGTSWVTDVDLMNNDASSSSVELIFHSDDGLSRSRIVTLSGGQSVLLSDAVHPGNFSGTNPVSWIGQLEIRSSGNISASARVFTAAANGGTYGSAYESYDPAVLSSNGAMSGLVRSNRYRSNVAYANSGDVFATVSYTLRREDGSAVASNQLIVPAHSTVQLALSRDVGISADDSRLLVEWSSTVPIYAMASVIDNRSNDPTNIPSSNSATELFFPVVGRTAGAQSTFWSTSATVSSRAEVSGNLTFAYRDNSSGQLYTRSVALAPRGTVSADDLNTFVGAPVGSGALTISSTVRVVGSVRVFNTLSDDSTYGSALLPQENSARSSRVHIKGVRRDDAYRLNVSISAHSSATDGTIRLFDDHGVEIESQPFHLEHESMIQVAMSRTHSAVRAGEVEVETHNGASITAVASSVDNQTGDTSVRESEQENERQHELEIHISPSTATINSAVTFSIGDSSGVSAVRWDLGDGSTSAAISPTHSFAHTGEFEVTVEVTLANGAVIREREDLHVVAGLVGGGSGPIDFSWSPLTPGPGQQVTFTASSTASGGEFKWKFPDNVRKSGGLASFTFPAAGSFEVELELEHSGSATLQANHIVTVGGSSTGGGASIDFTWSPVAPAAGQQTTFTATGGNGGTFFFKFPGDIRKSGASAAFTFATPGSYEVELEQEKEGSTTLHVTHVITVGGGSGGGGSIDFSWSPATPAAGQSITFTASGGNGGTFGFKFPGNIRQNGSTTTYTFAAAGSYEVELEQEKEGNVTLHATHVVTVGGGSTGGGTSTTVDFWWTPASARAGQTLTFTASSDVEPSGSSFYKWRMPDDSRPQGKTATYTFTSAGTFAVRVQIERPGLASIEREKNVMVAP